jgi:predicted aspartyl protease
MWDKGMARWTLAIVIFRSAQASAESSTILRLAAGDLPIVAVSVNGSGPHDFVLDTGASCTVVDARLGRSLGLASLGETRLKTAIGTRAADRVRLETLSIGSVHARNLLALTTDLDEIQSVDRRVVGVLGYDFLSKHTFLLDYGAKTVTWDAGERAQGVPVSYDDSSRGIRLKLGALRLVLDTAATTLVLLQTKGAPLGLDVRIDGRSLSRISAVDGFRLVRTGSVRELAAGARTLRDVPLVLVSRAGATGEIEEDGLLPARLFQRIYVDPKNRYVIFDPTGAGAPSLSTSAREP